MATNKILPFAGTDTGTNLLTDTEYAADAQRLVGNQPGIARSPLVNKSLRQASLIAAAVAQFIADHQPTDVDDSASVAAMTLLFENALKTLGIPSAIAAGTANAITADFVPDLAIANGSTVLVRATNTNTSSAVTFNPDGTGAKSIVKGNNLPLAIQDIAGAGHWLVLTRDQTLDKWVLANPARGIIPSGAVGGGTNKVFWENDQTVTEDYTITAGKNAMVAGPLTIADTKTVTVPSGSTLTIV